MESEAQRESTCLDLVSVLDFVTIEKRSETLNGSIPLRAAQGCKPFLDGNGAGFHARIATPAVIRQTKDGAKFILTDEGLAKVTGDYSARIEQLVDGGVLDKEGHWHRALRKGPVWQEKDVLRLWTGHLVRPKPGVWILVSGALNRRCFVNVREYVVSDCDAFVPLILELDLSSLRDRETWLDTELACLTPLRPDVSMSIVSLKEHPQPGRASCEFYDDEYNTGRVEGKYQGRYRKVTAGESRIEAPGRADCRLVVAGGPKLHGVGAFDRFATRHGWSRSDPTGHVLEYAVVRNICEVSGRWDGLSVRDVFAEMPTHVERLRRDWTDLYGADAIAGIEVTLEYTVVPHPHRGEPHFGLMPWVFVMTPSGWSSILDSCYLEGLDGMRAVISTDSYFEVPPLWQFYKPTRFEIRRGANLARVLPVPRSLLHAGLAEVPLDAASRSAAT